MSNQLGISVIAPEDEELAGRFAYELARDPANPIGVAQRLTFGDFAKSTMMVQVWRQDPEFQAVLREATQSITALDRLKDKDEFSLEIQERMKSMNDRAWLEAAKLYADIRGFVKKDTAPTTLVQTVIQVPMAQNLDDWEKTASASQRKLQDEAKVINGNAN